jgi:hypothetical protein
LIEAAFFGQRNVLLSQLEKMPKTSFVCFELTVGILTTSKMSLRIDFQNQLKLKDFEFQLVVYLLFQLFVYFRN